MDEAFIRNTDGTIRVPKCDVDLGYMDSIICSQPADWVGIESDGRKFYYCTQHMEEWGIDNPRFREIATVELPPEMAAKLKEEKIQKAKKCRHEHISWDCSPGIHTVTCSCGTKITYKTQLPYSEDTEDEPINEEDPLRLYSTSSPF